MFVYKDGKLIERKFLFYDYYKFVNVVILVGIKVKEIVFLIVYD